METVGTNQAEAHLGELRREVEDGEKCMLTRHGMAGARLPAVGNSVDRAVAALREIHRQRRELRPTLGGLTIRELFEEGRMESGSPR